ncbi:MAG: glucose-1-phosphate cytidylyltransferase [Chloroflexota bacterium]
MKVVILAGGLGTRLAEETDVRPKPMVEVGHRPILWHIMKHYAASGFTEFVIALGYKGEEIKRFFADYLTLDGDITVHLEDGRISRHRQSTENWVVDLVDTGFSTNTGGRVKRLAPWLAGERFMLTYGDGVSTVDLDRLLQHHETHRRLATLTAVRPPSRFGGLELRDDGTIDFTEKPQMGEGWINGGFMVVEPQVLSYIEGDDASFEADVLERLANERQLTAYKHDGFWQPMDTLRDVRYLRGLWTSGEAPWVTWQA